LVQLVQFPLSGFDGDYACPAVPMSVSFAGTPTKLVAGMPSQPLNVAASSAATAALAVTLTSSSAAGRFSAAATGPWTKTLQVSIGPGQTTSGSFFYRDTKAATATLRAAGSGLAPATQAVVVTPAAAAVIAVSPARASLRIGRRSVFTARVSDAYGNRVPSAPTWSVQATRVLALTSPRRAANVRVRALAPGIAVLRARVGRALGRAVVKVRR
jgi:hypothetical protein